MRSATATEEYQNQSSTPPKLSLFSLPRNPPETPGLATPPLLAPVSVPFHWEEAPGKPKTARSLDLFSDAKVAHFASPATVSDEPIVAGDLSSTASFRFPAMEEEDGKHFGSGRWGMSFRKTEVSLESSFDWSLPAGDGEDAGAGESGTKVKITRFRSRRSLLGTTGSMSHFVANLFKSIKQVIPRRHKRVKRENDHK